MSRVHRLLAYATVVKGCFNTGRYEDMYAYVYDIEVKRLSQVNIRCSVGL
ncbi:hypothetical protein HanXRQr2_Chr05g0216361 [Helianthus annuus]|uniref:Uncharacterized protein n=1 Tax=Helianthus annuus TaxID=4232 RepID=A0A9K3NN75_HELAN|nr:hypothetical protein HanXRQr2_Chr05g0216361 [Helianthus annuus]KAJ0922872.1 hypothetical protein HanPSC8_Chr05g0208961 [Helianthus annuus]